jgi:hypothetical protein
MSDQQGSERVIVTIDDAHLGDIQTVASALQGQGMTVENILSISGIIMGTCSRSSQASLQNVPGVVSVEEEGEARAI